MSNQTTNSRKNPYLIPLAVIIAGAIIAGAVIFTKNSQEETSSLTANKPSETSTVSKPSEIPTINTEGHIRGNPDAPVTIVEYSDFQCPFCSRFHPTVKQILADYPDQVNWVYKHFPLDQIHSQARPAAEASECVWEQKGDDGFWQFADLLFENQARLGGALYEELAGDLELDMSQFENCISSRKHKDKVEADYQEGIKAGVRGTPGSLVGGELVSGAVPYDVLKTAVEKALSDL